jgi:PPM family protein phosphatase
MANDINLIDRKYLLNAYSAQGDTRRAFEDRSSAQQVMTAGGLSLIVGIVADGVGSSGKGHLAAQMAIDTVVDNITHSNSKSVPEILRTAVEAANQVVYEAPEQKEFNASTTLVVGVIYNDRFFVVNVGDSRAYWVQENGKILQLTQDHNYFNIHGGNPNAEEADVLVNYIGKMPIVVDSGFYLGGELDRKKAFQMGSVGLPVKPGDSILLCSDGLIKTDIVGKRFVTDEEIVEAIQTELSDKASATKLVGIAEGRRVDDNVSIVTMQYLTPDLIEQVHAQSDDAQQKKKMRRIAAIAGVAGLLVALFVAVLLVVGSQKKLREGLAYQQTLDVAYQAAINEVNMITPTLAPSPTTTATVIPGAASVQEVNGEGAFIERNGQNVPLTPGFPINPPGAHLFSQGAGLRIIVGKLANTGEGSLVYLYPDSEAIVILGDELRVELISGRVLINPQGGRAAVFLPNHGQAVAHVSGSLMVVRIVDGAAVFVGCIEGDCNMENVNLQGQGIPEGSLVVFNSETGTFGTLQEWGLEDQLPWNQDCDFCAGDAVPTLTPNPATQTAVVEEEKARRATEVCRAIREQGGTPIPCPPPSQ